MKANITRKFKRTIAAGFSAAAVMCASVIHINALSPEDVVSDNLFHLVDFAGGSEISSFETYAEAANEFETVKEDYDNTGIVLNQKVLLAEYATAIIRSTDACEVNVTYTEDISGEQGYINGCYGIDAAYLTTDSNASKAEFMISGVKGWASIDDITIVPIQNITFRMTVYSVENKRLYHEIKTEIPISYFS
ncbi:MAG: hypothetical protein EOM64_09015 [Erysipelotrichia bacterium]|nr:hypothetical protein [Erysipelotrichia bacterium]